MHVKEVSIRQLINTGNYENVSAEVTVAVNKDEDPAQALDLARSLVEQELGLTKSTPPKP